MADKRIITRANKAAERVRKMIAEQTAWQGKKPSIVRVRTGEYLALVETGMDRQLGVEVRPAP